MKRLPDNARLVALAAILAALWFACGFGFLSREEERAWETVRRGQSLLWETQAALGIELSTESAENDRLRTGLIGVEWSPLTTTLGEIRAKRTSCHPLWTVQYLDWFDALGIEEGDAIVIYSSSSFPAQLLSALVAAELRGLDIDLSVSLGSSMWGANRPEFPWPEMARALRSGGFIHTIPAFYTPGGGRENGGGLSAEAMQLFQELADRDGVPLYIAENLKEAVAYKTAHMLEKKPKLLISIGGSNANMGASEIAVDIPPGLILPGKMNAEALGDGVIANAIAAGIPVLHMLNIKQLAYECGIPWDPASFGKVRASAHILPALLGLALFACVMIRHRRWRVEHMEHMENME